MYPPYSREMFAKLYSALPLEDFTRCQEVAVAQEVEWVV